MPTLTTVRNLSIDDAVAHVQHGAALIDLRPVDDYLDVHIRRSLELLYESGPGMNSRARDCLPLELPLILLDLGHGDITNAAASLRGKGFNVVGKLEDGINQWARAVEASTSTEVVQGNRVGKTNGNPPLILDVGDPGAGAIEGATFIPIEKLWTRVNEIADAERVVIASGYGVRAALAVGTLERAGVRDIVFWKP